MTSVLKTEALFWGNTQVSVFTLHTEPPDHLLCIVTVQLIATYPYLEQPKTICNSLKRFKYQIYSEIVTNKDAKFKTFSK